MTKANARVVSEHFVYPQKVLPTTADWRRDCSPSFLSVVVGTSGFGSKPWYAGIPACGSQYPSPVWMPAYHKKATTMQIHIGNLIRDELRRSGHTNQWLADRIGITPRTLQKLFNKPSIDTQQLLAICPPSVSTCSAITPTRSPSTSNLATCPHRTPRGWNNGRIFAPRMQRCTNNYG